LKLRSDSRFGGVFTAGSIDADTTGWLLDK
jgi:hypothetical protein